MKKKIVAFSFITVLVVTVALLSSSGTAFARSSYLSPFNTAYGNSRNALGTVYDCGVCHTTPDADSSSRNTFGAAWDGTPISSALGSVDTDRDGFTNAAELSAGTYPGNASSVPVTADTTRPTVTINQAAGQADPTSGTTINFSVVFSETVTGFATGDVAITGTAGGTKTATVSGSGTTYNVAVSGMTTSGTVIASIGAGVAQDAAANLNTTFTTTDNSVTYNAPDRTAPTVTINQAAGQADPTSGTTINFTVVFSETVTGFATGDVTITGTSGGTKTATVSGSGTTYNVAVSGMTTSGTVIASIGAGVAQDAAANLNTTSTNTDNSVTYNAPDRTAPSVTINQAAGQADPTNGTTINFTVVFSETVTGFATGDVAITGTAGGTKTATVSGSGTTYNVAVSGMTTSGTVIASIGANVAQDAASNGNTASTSTDNTVSYTLPPAPDTTPPSVTINQAAGQADPTNGTTINFTVVFSETVTGFATGDVAITGTAGGTKTATVSGSGTTYNVAVSGMTTSGTVIASIGANVAQDAASNGNTASTSTDNTVSYTLPPAPDTTPPSVTINQAAGQADPTNGTTINFTVVFSETVTGFATGDVAITGTAGGTKTATVSGSGTTYNVAVSGMTTSGTVTATIAAGMAQDAAGNPNTASTSTDNSVTYNAPDRTAPSVTINQAAGQADPTSGTTINFTVVFSETVTGFATGDVTISGTAGGTKTTTVSGSGTTYNVAVSGMTTSGTVIASIGAGVAQDAASNPNTASTSSDNSVTYNAPPAPISDTTRPEVTSFSISATSTSLTVPITSLVATDNVTVAGLIVTESATPPAASANGWSASAPATYTFASASVHTLYAWAKDGAGNVSATIQSASTSITLTPTDPPATTLPTFTNPTRVTNTYFPLVTIRRQALRGTIGRESVRVERRLKDSRKEFTVGDKTVRTLILEDRTYVSGDLEEVALSYLAQADDGGVYLFGVNVSAYSDGRVVGHDGSWLYGVDTDQLGIVIPAGPQAAMLFAGENVLEITQDKSEVVSVTETVRGPAGTFRNCLKIMEVFSDGAVVYKYYAPGVGLVKEVFTNGELNLISRTSSRSRDYESDDDHESDD